jgi:hypothetical protein
MRSGGLSDEIETHRRGRNLGVFRNRSPSLSDIVHVTYTGVVRDGYDQTGVFGPANTSHA